MRRITIISLFTFLTGVAYSQSPSVHPQKITAPVPVTVDLQQLHDDFAPIFFSTEMPPQGSTGYRRHLIDLKDSLYGDVITPKGPAAFRTQTDITAPEILSGWEGNIMTAYVPNDNDLAISNDGIIVSVMNSNIYMYDSLGTMLFTTSLAAFADTLGIVDGKFDPKVMYDPRADRFVLLFLAGFDPENTYIIIGFSQTEDPTGAWNLYALPGNPKDNNRWTDFPMFALKEEELFLTINLIIPDEPWQTGFSETLIWQMSLDNGYNAEPLDAIFWDSIYFGGAPIRNLNPVKGGSTTYGPDMYFLSNRNFAEVNDTIFMVHITGTLDDPTTELKVNYSRSNLSYRVPPQARQYSTNIFDTNDGRVLGSFYENGQIQFVSNCLDTSTGFCGIYHGVISDVGGTNTIEAHIIGDDTLDFGYANLSYTGKFPGDDQSIITFDHSAPTIYAGVSGVFYNWGGYSEVVNIHTGDTWVNVLSGGYERWGDYTGSQRKYNQPGVVWMSGTFGKYIESFPFTERNNATWIASLRSTVEPAVTVEQTKPIPSQVYPNPVQHEFFAEISLSSSDVIDFYLYDEQGNMIKYLLRAQAQSGNNVFLFNTAPLAQGVYYLRIVVGGQLHDTHKIVVVR